MASIDQLRASDGSGNAQIATVQSTRISGSSTLIVDTVSGINDTFIGSMGTPHTFTDPITSETITVISEATAVDFAGHVDGANLEIDTIAPGYSDLGSEIGDIIIIRPTTQWGDALADTLGVSMNDDASLKGDAVRDALDQSAAVGAGWTTLGVTPNTCTALGNRSYSVVVNSTDLTSILSPGMRLRLTRTVTAPNQCTSLNGTTQYYNKTSPNKLTFTDDFVASAWVKLSSYGAVSVIASRYNGTSGWYFDIEATGQVQLVGFNAGSSNFSKVISYQSIPLNKWVHVSAQLDMSTFTATTTTSYIMIDGVNVPAAVSRGGTNPTALVQAGNLEIGSDNGGLLPFPGKIAQVAIYNAKVTQATILASIDRTLTGSETSLASAYSFNNSITDLNTSTPNDLTAQGSAVATNADSPFGGQADGTISTTIDYGIITKIAYSSNTTITVQVPEGCTIPTTGGVTALDYSGVKAPFGMPIQRGKWELGLTLNTDSNHTSVGAAGYFSTGALTIPIGEWDVDLSGSVFYEDNATNTGVIGAGLGTTTSSFATGLSRQLFLTGAGLADVGTIAQIAVNARISLAAQTPYYLNASTQSGNLVSFQFYAGTGTPTYASATPSHL